MNASQVAVRPVGCRCGVGGGETAPGLNDPVEDHPAAQEGTCLPEAPVFLCPQEDRQPHNEPDIAGGE